MENVCEQVETSDLASPQESELVAGYVEKIRGDSLCFAIVCEPGKPDQIVASG